MFTWEIDASKQEEIDELCLFHELRTGKKAGYYSATMRMNAKVFVKIIPPLISANTRRTTTTS